MTSSCGTKWHTPCVPFCSGLYVLAFWMHFIKSTISVFWCNFHWQLFLGAWFLIHQHRPKSWYDANLIVTDGTGGCRFHNLLCRQTKLAALSDYDSSLVSMQLIVRRAGLLLSQQDFEWRWSVPLFQCLTVLEFSFILFDLCLLITFFNFIMDYVLIVTFWIFTYHKIWILSIMFCFIWSYWIIYFLACL